MKDINLLVWLTQLGFGTAVPLAVFVLGSIWLRQRFDLGVWVVLCGVLLGLFSAIGGLRSSMQAMERMAKGGKKAGPDPISFNDHD